MPDLKQLEALGRCIDQARIRLMALTSDYTFHFQNFNDATACSDLIRSYLTATNFMEDLLGPSSTQQTLENGYLFTLTSRDFSLLRKRYREEMKGFFPTPRPSSDWTIVNLEPETRYVAQAIRFKNSGNIFFKDSSISLKKLVDSTYELYDIFAQAMDRQLAFEMYTTEGKKQALYREGKFEFLAVLSPEQISAALKENVSFAHLPAGAQQPTDPLRHKVMYLLAYQAVFYRKEKGALVTFIFAKAGIEINLDALTKLFNEPIKTRDYLAIATLLEEKQNTPSADDAVASPELIGEHTESPRNQAICEKTEPVTNPAIDSPEPTSEHSDRSFTESPVDLQTNQKIKPAEPRTNYGISKNTSPAASLFAYIKHHPIPSGLVIPNPTRNNSPGK